MFKLFFLLTEYEKAVLDLLTYASWYYHPANKKKLQNFINCFLA